MTWQAKIYPYLEKQMEMHELIWVFYTVPAPFEEEALIQGLITNAQGFQELNTQLKKWNSILQLS